MTKERTEKTKKERRKLTKKEIWHRVIEYLVVAAIFAAVACVYFLVGRKIVYKMMELNNSKNYGELKAFLQGYRGWGVLIVIMLEMLQMIVVFIPAEFVQVASGLAYPVYFALPLCMFGVFLGASVIFVIVRCLHIRLDILERKTGKIQKFVSNINKSTPMTVIMYILFVMPLIPFGAIAYFASSSKIKYPRYALVCTTGVIPSILSSYLLGNVMINFLGKGTKSFVIAVALVAVGMVLLLVILAYIIKRIFFVKTYKKPNFFLYHIMYFFANLYFSCKVRMRKKDKVKIKKPCVILGRHTSFFDFFYACKMIYPHRPTIVTNKYYYDYKKTRLWTRSLGCIPKRLFTTDIEPMRQMYAAKEQKRPIVLYPEGRLSNSGASMGIVPSTGKFIKKLGLPVYTCETVGGYFAKPKWRNKSVRHKVELSLKELFTADQLAEVSVEEVQAALNRFFTYDESALYAQISNKRGHTNVEGLENVLYRCKHCGAEYTLTSSGNKLICSHCGKEFVFDENYTTDGCKISDWLENIKESIRKTPQFTLTENCEIARFSRQKKRMVKCGKGVCTLTPQGLTYKGTDGDKETEITQTPNTLSALAYSCNEEFEFYVGQELVYFYPENKQSVVKWSLIWDVLCESNAFKPDAAEKQ